MKNVVLLFLLLQTFALPAIANEPPPPPPIDWQNTISLGGSINTGNSDTTNLNAKYTSDFKHFNWNYHLSVEGELDTANGQRTAQNATGIGAIRYFFKPYIYAFSKGDVTYDEFATYDFVIKAAGGLGRVFIDNDKNFFSLELGPGSTHQRISGTQDFQTLFIVTGAGLYKYKISPTASLNQAVSVDYSKTYTHTESISAIRTKVMEGLALEVSFTLKNDSAIPVNSKNTKKTDTTTKITIVYDF